MKCILIKETDVMKAIIPGAPSYQVYQTKTEDAYIVEAGMVGVEPIIRQQLGLHQEDQADELFTELTKAFGGDGSVLDMSKYAQTEPAEEVDEDEEDTDE